MVDTEPIYWEVARELAKKVRHDRGRLDAPADDGPERDGGDVLLR